jgi:hypothetical protein
MWNGISIKNDENHKLNFKYEKKKYWKCFNAIYN